MCVLTLVVASGNQSKVGVMVMALHIRWWKLLDWRTTHQPLQMSCQLVQVLQPGHHSHPHTPQEVLHNQLWRDCWPTYQLMVVSTVGCVVIGVCCTYCCALWHGLAGVDISFFRFEMWALQFGIYTSWFIIQRMLSLQTSHHHQSAFIDYIHIHHTHTRPDIFSELLWFLWNHNLQFVRILVLHNFYFRLPILSLELKQLLSASQIYSQYQCNCHASKMWFCILWLESKVVICVASYMMFLKLTIRSLIYNTATYVQHNTPIHTSDCALCVWNSIWQVTELQGLLAGVRSITRPLLANTTTPDQAREMHWLQKKL